MFPRLFGPRQCERIIQAGLSAEREPGLVAAGADDEENHLARIADIAWLTPAAEHQWIFTKLAGVVERANRIFQFDLTGFTEEAQFTCYDSKGAFYDWHQDGLEGELASRKLSMVVQLSAPSDYRGGELELFSLACEPGLQEAWAEELRVQGTVIVFPAFEFHRVTPIKSGRRYSLVCWIGGPPFR